MNSFPALRPTIAALATLLIGTPAGVAAEPPDSASLIDGAARLAGDGPRRVLLLGNGEHIDFTPEVTPPARADHFEAMNRSLTLRGENGRYRLSDRSGRQWRFVAGRPTHHRVSGRAWTSVRQGASRIGADGAADCPVLCDDRSQPAPSAFETGPHIPGAILLDARPASCRSYFDDYPPIERGSRIESGVALLPDYAGLTPTPRSFPSIDFIGATELITLTSLDLGATSYDATDEPDALLDALLHDGQDIERQVLEPLSSDGRIEHHELGTHILIDASPARRITLHLVVRHGLATAAQIAQIERARHELQQRYGIDLQVIEIP